MFQADVITDTFDGIQTTFNTSFAYKTGTLRIFSPLLETSADVVENGGTSFTLALAPLVDDVVIAFYQVQP